MYRVYFGHAMDDQSETGIVARFDTVVELFHDSGVEVVHTWSGRPKPELAVEVVRADLQLMSTCDLLLVDMTVPDRNYVGCVGELVYAHLGGIPSIVNIGQTGYGDRLWLEAHCTKLVHTWADAIAQVAQLLEGEAEALRVPSDRWELLMQLADN